jgi:hypothetical protein
VLKHSTGHAVKIGIANVGSGRLDKHNRRGWVLYRTFECHGTEAQRIERAVLQWWRTDLGLKPYLRVGDGWTETVDGRKVSALRTWNRAKRAGAVAPPT